MGFDERCGASGLTIGYEEPCRMFVIRPHSYLPLHYQSRWEPAGLVPFKGVYNGESRMEDLEITPAIKMQHASLVTRSRVLEDRKKRWPKDIDEKMKTDLSTFCDLVERGELETKTAHGVFVTAPFYVREDVYQHIIEEQKGFHEWIGADIEEHLHKLVRMRFDTKERWLNMLKVGKETGNFDYEGMAEINVELDKIDGTSHGQYLASGLIQNHEDFLFSDEDAKVSLAKAQVEFELFSMGLEVVAPWQPTHKARCDDYEFLAKWHRALAEMAEATHKRREEL